MKKPISSGAGKCSRQPSTSVRSVASCQRAAPSAMVYLMITPAASAHTSTSPYSAPAMIDDTMSPTPIPAAASSRPGPRSASRKRLIECPFCGDAPYILCAETLPLPAPAIRPSSIVWIAVLALLATIAYAMRVRHEMVDFAVYRTAGARAIDAAPLFRADDGHYQFKYFPAFALAMTPLAVIPEEPAKAIWFAISVALLVVLVRQSIRTLPDRRQTERLLAWLAVVLMAKFYLHELNLGQTNVLLGVLLTGALAAAIGGRTASAGVLVGAGVFVKPYALILVPWLVFAAGAAGVAAFAATFAGGLLLPAVVYGWSGNLEQLVGWYRTVTDTTAPNLL